jgi:tetratricopeptide (TPR) repeat protein
MKEEASAEKALEMAALENEKGQKHFKKGEYAEALKAFQRALHITEKILGKMHPHTAASYNNIGAVHNSLDQYDKALIFFQEALDIQEQVLGKMHLSTAASYNNMGSVYDNLDQYDKALAFYQEALDIFKETLAFGHSNIQTVLENYIDVLEAWGNERPEEDISDYEGYLVKNFGEYEKVQEWI